MKESDFLDHLVSISVLAKNVKMEPKKALDFRSSNGHPNSLRVGASMVANHLQTLLLNVSKVFR